MQALLVKRSRLHAVVHKRFFRFVVTVFTLFIIFSCFIEICDRRWQIVVVIITAVAVGVVQTLRRIAAATNTQSEVPEYMFFFPEM